MSASSFVAGPLFTNGPVFGPVEDEEEMENAIELLKPTTDPSQEKFHRKRPGVALPLNILQIQLSVWEDELPSLEDFNRDIDTLRICWETMTREVANFVAEYNKADKKKKAKMEKSANEPTGKALELMKDVVLGDNLLDDHLAFEGREGGIPADRLLQFAKEEFDVYRLSDAALAKFPDQPETKKYREVLDEVSEELRADKPDAGRLVLRAILLKDAHINYKQMVKRLTPASAAPSPVSPVKPAPVSKSSSSKKKREDSDDEEEDEKPKAKKARAEPAASSSSSSSKKKKEESDDEMEVEKPKAKKAKAEPAPPPFAFKAPSPAPFVFDVPLPAATLADATKLLSEAGVEWLISKTQQLLKKDAQVMADLVSKIRAILQPVATQAVATRDNRVFVEKIKAMTEALEKC